mgnify:CR=1 FL=1
MSYFLLINLANKLFINNLNSNLGKLAKEYIIKERKLDEKTIEYNKMDEKLVDTKVEPKYFDYKKLKQIIN